jgi:hypothetical protein
MFCERKEWWVLDSPSPTLHTSGLGQSRSQLLSVTFDRQKQKEVDAIIQVESHVFPLFY